MNANLPLQLTRFIGREREIGALRRLLVDARLVTLTGPGGSGKTRLAIEVARRVAGAYRDGAVWVDLAVLADPRLLPQLLAAALGVSERREQALADVLADALADKQLLILLDNCEHLVAAVAPLANGLLRRGPELRLLATSREPLALRGERRYPVPAVTLPAAALLDGLDATGAAAASSLAGFAASEAIALFVDRAAAMVPGFALTPENVRAVAALCRRLDGLPLAIELAAAQVNVLSVDQIAGRLDEQLALLATDTRSQVAGRHQTLQAALDWSYDVLNPLEQTLLRRLSVFAAGCTLAVAEAVCTGDGITGDGLLALMSALVNKSLVVAQTLQHDEARYGLLETTRQYAREKLVAAGEWARLRDRHLDCYRRRVAEAAPKLDGPDQKRWLGRLVGEYDELRAALAWALEGGATDSGRLEAGLYLANDLYQFWTIRDHVQEGLTWYSQLGARATEGVDPTIRARALAYASLMAGFRGHTAAQMQFGQEAAAVAEAAGAAGRRALVWATTARAWAARAAGDHETEYSLGLQQIHLFRELGDRLGLGMGLSLWSFAAMATGRFEAARAMLDEGLPLLREAGNPYRLAMALNYQGDLERCEGHDARAQRAYEQSIALLEELDAVRDLASARHNLGHACLHQDDFDRARILFEESMAAHESQQNRPGMTECLLGFAALAIVSELAIAGARLLAAAEMIGGERLVSAWAATRREYEHYLARARAGLTEAEFAAAQAAGQRLSLEQAVAYARKVAHQAATARTGRRQIGALTPREREVAALIGRGLSNGDIAAHLVLSKRTVESHVARIRARLAFTERAQIVRWAIENGLSPTGTPDESA